jgi:hypothetical protein
VRASASSATFSIFHICGTSALFDQSWRQSFFRHYGHMAQQCAVSVQSHHVLHITSLPQLQVQIGR